MSYARKYEDVFPDIPDLQTLGIRLKELRLNKKLSQKSAGEFIGRSGIWVRNLENWASGYRPWANGLIVYMFEMGFSLVDSMLLVGHFNLWPDSEYEMRYMINTISMLHGEEQDRVYNSRVRGDNGE